MTPHGQELFMLKLNTLINCNPAQCQRTNCPLYFEEMQCCDAKRFLGVFNADMQTKFENTKMYSIFDE